MSSGQKTKSKSSSASISKPKSTTTTTSVYNCEFSGCEKQFGFLSHLRQHEKTHTKAKQKDEETVENIELITIGEEGESMDSGSDSDSEMDSPNNSKNSSEEENLGNSKNKENPSENPTRNPNSTLGKMTIMKTTTPSKRWEKRGGQFACHLCPATMKHKNSLSIHLKGHNDVKPFGCDQCSFRSKQMGNVRVHVMKVHSGLRAFKCPEPSCAYAAKSKDHLNTHLRTHSQSKDFKCTFKSCSYACNQASALRVHLRLHSDERLYPCPLCDYKGRTQGARRAHMFTHTGEKFAHCTYSGCDYACGDVSKLAIHIRAIHTNERPYKCPHPGCGFSSAQRPNLNTHIKTHHSSSKDERPFKCNLCPDYAGKRAFDLEGHVRRQHTKERPLEFKCKWEGCSYITGSQSAMRNHQVVHTKERNYECGICHKKFGHRCTLQVHLDTHNDEKKYKCELCDFRSKQRGNVQKHMIVAHTGEEKLAKCQEEGCGYEGKTICHLKHHLKSHQKKRKFTCSVPQCDFSCTVFHAWRIHLKGHREKGEK